MLHVDLDNILTHDELATKAEEVLRKADDEGKIVVITRNGRPAVAVLKLEMLEDLSGRSVSAQQPNNQVPGPDTAPAPAPAPAEPPAAPEPAPAPEPTPPMAEMPFNAAPAPEEKPKDTSGLPDMP